MGQCRDGAASTAHQWETRIGVAAGYWLNLQSLSWSEADAFKASQIRASCISAARLRRPLRPAAELLDRFGSLGAVMAADPDKLAQVLKEDRVSVILLKAVHASVKAIVREPLEDRPVISSASALMDYLSVTMRHEPIEATRISSSTARTA